MGINFRLYATDRFERVSGWWHDLKYKIGLYIISTYRRPKWLVDLGYGWSVGLK